MQPYLAPQLWKTLQEGSANCWGLKQQDQEKLHRLIASARIQEARKNFPIFSEAVVRDESGNSVILGALHLTWITHIDWCWKHDLHAGILSLWRHGKSTLVAISLPLFCLGINPNLRVKIVCNTDDEASKRVALLRHYIEGEGKHNDYAGIFPNIRPADKGRWTDHQLYVQRSGMGIDPTIEAKGVLTTGTGGGADLLVFDDPVDMQNSVRNTATRPQVLEHIQSVWLPRLSPHGRTVYIATAWHQQDATHKLMENPRFCFLIQEVSEDFGSIKSHVKLPHG